LTINGSGTRGNYGSMQSMQSMEQQQQESRSGDAPVQRAAIAEPASAHADQNPATAKPNLSLSRAVETDEMLVDRIRSGDRAAFDEIYGRYFKRVFAFLDKRLRNRADTEETTQEVFINIFSSLDSYRGEAPFAAWVFGLSRRTLAARFRRKRHPTVPLLEDNEEQSITNLASNASGEPTPLENYEMHERAAQLSDVLEHEVTAEQRQLFEMHHIQSVPIAEIAKTLSKSEDSVKSGLYRTRKLLLR
jgi:RNA polymerase sigma-70 factor (ECF subfamily)